MSIWAGNGSEDEMRLVEQGRVQTSEEFVKRGNEMVGSSQQNGLLMLISMC